MINRSNTTATYNHKCAVNYNFLTHMEQYLPGYPSDCFQSGSYITHVNDTFLLLTS